jgi:type IV pilus assembly protein PilN
MAMKIPINLASQPFRRDRPMVAASIVVSVALTALLVMLVVLARQDKDQLVGINLELGRLNRQIHDASKEQSRLEGIMRQPQNASVLEWSQFVNTLIYQKAISWSRLFSDLEKALPYDVKVVAIHPQVDSRNHVTLDMTLGSDKTASLYQAIHSLEDSAAFGVVTPGSSSPPTQAEPLWRYRFTVSYVQKL